MRTIRLSVFVSMLALWVIPQADACFGAAPSTRPVDFNRDIRPILSNNCYFCHGPDKGHRKADLRLDIKEGLLGEKGEAGVVVPKKPLESDLYQRITSTDEDEVMPHAKSNKKLTQDQKDLIKRWIELGAPWEGHWAYVAPKAMTPPATDIAGFTHNAVDWFVGTALIDHGMKPSDEADKVTLIRRLSLDLTGLPPTPEEVDAFVADTRPDAYERLVDRLLVSPHYGERMAVFWLDLVRYADTIGFHNDKPREVWPYRDWVIRAFNENKPFDRFTVEQLAGDLLPGATRDQRVGSAYNRLLLTTEEGGAVAKEYVKKYESDRVRNVSTTWLGATVGCAQCHDHKFDPFTAKDFYRLGAFFADIQEPAVKLPVPELMLPTPEQEAELKRIDTALAAATETLNASTPELAAAEVEWEEQNLALLEGSAQWTPLTIVSASSARKARLAIDQSKSSVKATGETPPPRDTYTIKGTTKLDRITAVRIDALPDDALPAHGPGRAEEGSFALTSVDVRIDKRAAKGEKPAADEDENVDEQANEMANDEQGEAEPPAKEPKRAPSTRPSAFWVASASHEQKGNEASTAIDSGKAGEASGWSPAHPGRVSHAVFELGDDLALDNDAALTLTLAQNAGGKRTLGRFMVSVTDAARPVRAIKDLELSPELSALIRIDPAKRTAVQKQQIATYFRSIAEPLAATRAELAKLTAERAKLQADVAKTLTTISGPPRVVRVLSRGDWQDEKGEIVTPGVPGFMRQLQVPVDRGASRLDLANWIVARDNPLTARVLVNRLWKQFYGDGLAKPLDDLGAQGQPPSHPELLDYLAVQFMDSGWDVKHLIRLMVTSGTYRQSSNQSNDLREKDPYNTWLARQGTFRLDAEFVRDNAMAAAGLLSPKMFGPSVKPYQPDGYWRFFNYTKGQYPQEHGEALYRRGVYSWWQRTYLNPTLMNFDAPNREECTAERVRANTPQQALTLLNDPTYVEAGRVFAQQICKIDTASDVSRIAWAFRRATSRPPTETETTILTRLIEKHRSYYATDKESAAKLVTVGESPDPKGIDVVELAAWTNVARAILNLHETVTRN